MNCYENITSCREQKKLKIVLRSKQEAIGTRLHKRVFESHIGRESNEIKSTVDEMKEMGKIRSNCKKTKNSSRIKVYIIGIEEQGRHMKN